MLAYFYSTHYSDIIVYSNSMMRYDTVFRFISVVFGGQHKFSVLPPSEYEYNDEPSRSLTEAYENSESLFDHRSPPPRRQDWKRTIRMLRRSGENTQGAFDGLQFTAVSPYDDVVMRGLWPAEYSDSRRQELRPNEEKKTIRMLRSSSNTSNRKRTIRMLD